MVIHSVIAEQEQQKRDNQQIIAPGQDLQG